MLLGFQPSCLPSRKQEGGNRKGQRAFPSHLSPEMECFLNFSPKVPHLLLPCLVPLKAIISDPAVLEHLIPGNHRQWLSQQLHHRGQCQIPIPGSQWDLEKWLSWGLTYTYTYTYLYLCTHTKMSSVHFDITSTYHGPTTQTQTVKPSLIPRRLPSASPPG